MQRANNSPFFTAERIKADIETAPEHVEDPGCAYDPNDSAAGAEYFKDAVVSLGGGIRSSVRRCWQTRVNGARSRTGTNNTGTETHAFGVAAMRPLEQGLGLSGCASFIR